MGNGEKASAKNAITIPGIEAVRKVIKKTSTKQVVDLAIFSAGIFVMYRFGKGVAETIDNQMPTEKSMIDMMKGMGGMGGPGAPPSPF